MTSRIFLVLWDIDRTLLSSGGAGGRAFSTAGKKVLGENFNTVGLDTFGRLDSAIIRDAIQISGKVCSEDLFEKFKKEYIRCFEEEIKTRNTIELLPGSRDLVECLAKYNDTYQGILSGNIPEIGHLKIIASKLDPEYFDVWVGGTEASTRSELVPIAINRFNKLKSKSITNQSVVIIGDTPRDIECAKANNCVCISVATGNFSCEKLEKSGADIVFDDLSETNYITGFR
jgi:phosphoglycolate phosphatase-like HAD superfamily hydrolase